MNNNRIIVLRPMKAGDPTEYTYQWAEKAIKLMKEYGYNILDIRKDEVTYENVSNAINSYRPRLLVTFSHGCPTSIQGQYECVLTRRFDVNELTTMQNFREIIQPLRYSSGCVHTCKLEQDICNPICTNDTNIGLLKGSIIITIACYSSVQLGKCSVKYGVDSYSGYKDLMLFPVDDQNSQDIFGDIHLVYIKEILEGKSITEAEIAMNNYEDELLRKYKEVKYIALPLLWNKLNREIHGNKNITIFG